MPMLGSKKKEAGNRVRKVILTRMRLGNVHISKLSLCNILSDEKCGPIIFLSFKTCVPS